MASHVVVPQQRIAEPSRKRGATRIAGDRQRHTLESEVRASHFSFSEVPLFARGEAVASEPRRSSSAASLPWPIQAKLEIGAVDDPLEREADRVAERVMRMPDPAAFAPSFTGERVQRQCSSCAEEDRKKKKHEETHEKLSRKESGGAAALSGTAAPPIVHDVLRSPGQPLDAGTRSFFEPRFGHDLSQVRVHTDSQAAASAQAVGAHAFTVGRNIAFGQGLYAPHDSQGRRLLAHELTHVLQQQPGGQQPERNGNVLRRDLATAPPATTKAQPDLTDAQIQEAIAFNQARYNKANTELIQNLLGGPTTGKWTAANIEAIAATQEEYGLTKDGKVGNETFRFLDREQRNEHMSTSTANCLVSFTVIGPDGVTRGRDDPTHCHFNTHHRIEAQFSPRCNCADFEYRQFIAGHWHRTRGGTVTDLPIREVGGVLLDNFNEDADTSDPVPNYGHRDQAAGANVEDHYIDAAGNDDQQHGCRYRAEDFPGFNPLGDCQPGDRYDLLTSFRGEIRRRGTPIQTKFWTGINLVNWRP